MKKHRWGVMISGRGSNLAALLDLRDEIEIRVVISSHPQAPGLLRAKRAGVPTLITPFVSGTKKIDWPRLQNELVKLKLDFLFLAGFMKVIPESFVAQWENRILNLHPSLLPAYPGLKSIERAHEDRADIGATVHIVTAEVDAGEVICQRRCLKADEVHGYSLPSTEFLVHLEEQRAVKEAIRRWRNRINEPTLLAAKKLISS